MKGLFDRETLIRFAERDVLHSLNHVSDSETLIRNDSSSDRWLQAILESYLAEEMATETGLLPLRTQPEYETAPIHVPLRESENVFDALSSQTARTILAVLGEEPMTVTGVAETVGTTVQNAMYHTNKLEANGLVRMVDTWYSEKGKEMPVYAASCEQIVLTTESEDDSLTHHGPQT